MCDCPTKVGCNCHKARHNTAKEMHALIGAWAGGEILEVREIGRSNETWTDRPYGYQTRPPNFSDFQYRIKRTPRTLYTLIRKDGAVLLTDFSRERLDDYIKGWSTQYGPVTVIESVEKL